MAATGSKIPFDKRILLQMSSRAKTNRIKDGEIPHFSFNLLINIIVSLKITLKKQGKNTICLTFLKCQAKSNKF